MECGRKAVRVKAPVHPHLMSTREGGAATRFYIEFQSDFRQILARFLEGKPPDLYIRHYVRSCEESIPKALPKI